MVIQFLVYASAALMLAACTRSATTVAPTLRSAATPPAFVSAQAAEALPQLVAAERTAAHHGQLALLAQLWAEDARVIDGRGTLDTADDYHWEGRPAILDRYAVAVFPSPPPLLDAPPTLVLQMQGDSAVAVAGVDRWTFVRQGDRWWIQELAYMMGSDP